MSSFQKGGCVGVGVCNGYDEDICLLFTIEGRKKRMINGQLCNGAVINLYINL